MFQTFDAINVYSIALESRGFYLILVVVSLFMEEFNSILPGKKVVEYVEELRNFLVKELKEILKSYREKTYGVKADLILRVYDVFCRAKKSNSIESGRFKHHFFFKTFLQ